MALDPNVSAEQGRGNDLLARLPASELDRVLEHSESLEAEIRLSVYEPDGPIDHVYFPLTAVFSMVAVVEGNAAIEVGTIGREGMVGLPVFLGRSTSPNAAFCQVSGLTLRMRAGAFRTLLSEDGALHQQLHRFTQATLILLAQNVACNRNHTMDQRAARWLLMTADRVGNDEFVLTQEFLGQMLGVRRATVSDTARRLGAAGLIAYHRGRITVQDRPGLEATACKCYAIVRNEFAASGLPT